jgi:hypothetical protein
VGGEEDEEGSEVVVSVGSVGYWVGIEDGVVGGFD